MVKEVYLQKNIIFISGNNKQLFIADNDTVNFVNYQVNSQAQKTKLFSLRNLNLNHQIINLQRTALGVVVLTQDKDNLHQYQLWAINSEIKSLIQLQLESLIYAIAPNQKWLALAKKEATGKMGFQIINLENITPINLLIEDFFPSQLLALDNHHGLAIYYQPHIKKDDTFLRFFTRRGTWGDSYSLSIPLSKITLNQFHPNYFLAREKFTNNVILIQINPLKVTRIALHFTPYFIISLPNQFLCANHQGEISCVDLEGNYLGYNQLDLTISAMTTLTDNLMILATKKKQKSALQIYKINS